MIVCVKPNLDVVIVGAGPGGLSAALTAATDGLKVTLIEGNEIGGQARQSSKLENFIGFPGGVTGARLTALAWEQCRTFGVAHLKAWATNLTPTGVVLDDGSVLQAKSVVLSLGLLPKPLEIDCDQTSRQRIQYGADQQALANCRKQVAIVGGGNSAGQAALHLAGTNGRQVTLLVRRPIEETMSDYLVQRILNKRSIVVVVGSVIAYQGLQLTTEHGTFHCDDLLVFIGAQPSTNWLPLTLDRTKDGYIQTDSQFATTHSGVFAIGDCRDGNPRRLAAAIGEGSMVARSLFEYLKGYKFMCEHEMEDQTYVQ